MSRQVLRHWICRQLPALHQGSTLSIRSSIKNTNLSVRSEWRDDAFLSVLQESNIGVGKANIKLSQETDRRTSMGRDEYHLLLELSSTAEDLGDTEAGDELQDADNMVIMHDGSVVADSKKWNPPPAGFRRIERDDGLSIITEDRPADIDFDQTSLALEVPEKLNIECDLSEGGSISIHNKIEGDVRLRTTNGDVVVTKLRGHAIDIEAEGAGNTIFSADLLEAQSLRIHLPCSGRLRAKRIHASTCDIQIGQKEDKTRTDSSKIEQVAPSLFDGDDGGAICDFSSLYVTGDATVDVQTSNDTQQSIRIKSSHGHVVVQVSAPMPRFSNPMAGELFPIVDMGGVNGSCEVFVASAHGTSFAEGTSCRVHFDSVAPDSVSILMADMGDMHVTMDRKVESDLRLLSSSNIGSTLVDIDTLLLDEEDEEYHELVNMLTTMDALAKTRCDDPIEVRTEAFTAKENPLAAKFDNVFMVDGWVENKSAEPDSRFDRKLRGETGSVGKIRLDGAANQALQGFQKAGGDKCVSSFIRPIIAVAGSEKIIVETLSWLGNIARRYGLDDRRETDELGRTATRRGRSLEPPKE